jgi:hypothetical protein
MKSITKNNYKWRFIVIFVVFLSLFVVFLAVREKLPWTKGPILSKTDYRIFACGKEIFFEPDQLLLNKKRNGLFARSESGSIIADGMPKSFDDVLLTSFFDAAGGTLKLTKDHKNLFCVPTKEGVLEFKTGNLCDGKKADLYVLEHRIETSTEPWSIFSRIGWKYWDFVFSNNYGKVPPGNCLIFIFDTEDVLDRPWPTCAAHDEALAAGELILEGQTPKTWTWD